MAAPADRQATQPAPSPDDPAPAPLTGTGAGSEHPRIAEPCQAGQVLGEAATSAPRYVVGELLGLGSTGAVFAVEDRDLARHVALKVLRQDQAQDRDRRAAFLTEARTTARLAHPNVLPVLDLRCTEDGRPFFTMHRISGRTLLEALQPLQRGAAATAAELRPLVSRVLAVGIAVCHALGYAHAQRIIHQDIKPENILLGDFGEVLVLDWGSAAVIPEGGGSVTAGLYGTPLYMAPEQARNAGIDARADVYGVGATLWHGLLGRPPFWRDDPEAFWAGKRAGALDEPTAPERERFPPELLAILRQSLAPQPSARYASIDLLRQDLEAFQGGLMVRAHHYGWWTRAARWCHRHPTLLTAAGLLLAGVATCLGLLERERQLQAHAWHPDEDLSFTSQAALAGQWTACFHQGFDPTAFDPLPTSDPRLRVADGWLTLQGTDATIDIAHTAQALGSLRVEWSARSLEGRGNLNCFVGGPNRLRAMTLHIGGWGSPNRVALTEPGTDVPIDVEELPAPIVNDRIYHFVLECVDRELRLTCDGVRVFTHLDVAHDLGDDIERFGFDCYSGHIIQIRDVRVSHQLPARLTSPLAIPDELTRLGQWRDAAQRYDAIARAFPRTDMGRMAQVREAFAVDAGGDPAGCDRLLRTFIQEPPQDALTAQGMIRLLRHAETAEDGPTIARLREALCAFAGNSFLVAPLTHLVREYEAQLPRTRDMARQTSRPQALAQLRQVVAEIDHWRDRFGVEPMADGLWEKVAGDCCLIGMPEEALRLLPRSQHRQRARALMEQGLLAEASAEDPGWHQPALLAGHPTEALASFRTDAETAVKAALWLHDDATLAALKAGPERRLGIDIRTPEDAERMVGLLPMDGIEANFGATLRLLCLLRLGRSQEALDHYHHASARGLAYLAQGRVEDALRIAASDFSVRCGAAVLLVARGEAPAGAALFATDPQPMLFVGDELTDRVLLPALVANAAGQPDAAHAWLERWREPRLAGQQVSSAVARYVLGDINAATFARQPVQLGLAQRLLIGQAVRAELAGDLATARACYRQLVQVPLWQRVIPAGLDEWVRLRLTQAHEAVPWNWGLQILFILRG